VLSPTASFVLVLLGLAFTLVPGLIAASLAAHHLGVLLRLRRASRGSRVDRPGSVVLAGRVIADEDDGEPVKLVIEQERVTSARSPVVLWREVARTPTLQPFVLALESGAQVRVEPDPDTRIATELSLEAAGDSRRRCASIRAGDEIQLVGALRASTHQRPKSSAFRGAVAPRGADDTPPPRSLVVRRHPLEPLLLSKGKLARERTQRVVLHLLVAATFAFLSVMLHLGALAPFYELALWGRATWARVTAVETADGERSLTPEAGDRLRLAVELSDASGPGRTRRTLRRLTSEPIDSGMAAQVLAAAGQQRSLRVAILVKERDRHPPLTVLGKRPRAPLAAVPLVALAAVVSLGYLLAGRRARPWFERPRLDEHEAQLVSPLLVKARG
jgi:hypothetical protein